MPWRSGAARSKSTFCGSAAIEDGSANHPRALLARAGIRPKKRLGQHFLMDGGTSTRIAKLAVDAPGDRILEIGAGTGALTAALLRLGADVTAIDIDPDMLAVLAVRDDLPGLTTHLADALKFDYAAWAGDDADWRVAGNLPYNVGTPTLVLLAQLARPPQRIVAMIQKDVADRLTAKPNTPSYGSLTNAIGLTMSTERAISVPPSAFFPKPGVDSTVVVLRRRDEPAADVHDRAQFQKVVRAAFAYRRKTLVNSLMLALGIERDHITGVLTQLSLEPDVRGESLDLRTFAAIANALAG